MVSGADNSELVQTQLRSEDSKSYAFVGAPHWINHNLGRCTLTHSGEIDSKMIPKSYKN